MGSPHGPLSPEKLAAFREKVRATRERNRIARERAAPPYPISEQRRDDTGAER